MHRFPSAAAIRRIRLAALLLVLKCLMVPASAVLLVHGIVMHKIPMVHIGLGLAAASLVLQLLQVLFAARTFCPLCRTPVLAKKYCRKHRSARPLFGSHRLRVAAASLATGKFRCPYCGEPSSLEVRDPSRPRSYTRG
ncbi:MAG: hypothetical protein H7A49_01610 [Akkermansiaceae bacterium]|nr:hypothetical protein [Akkermansiaceae bacterium]MCP5542582.1 hypothetical protein [Akkermansiaceae bacterium]MCP5547878.1 hypothetical protein [Akkermansiaceae bacterium]